MHDQNRNRSWEEIIVHLNGEYLLALQDFNDLTFGESSRFELVVPADDDITGDPVSFEIFTVNPKVPVKAYCKPRKRYFRRYHVKNVNPSTPLVCPNRRFHKNTTPDANTYCGCDSAVTYFSAMSNKGTCSSPTPKCTPDSFFSLQTPHNRTGQQEPGQAHSHSPQTKKGSKMFQCGYCFKCPR